jgi:hypothetical protein
MKSPEVYKLLRTELAPFFKASGFKRTKGLLSWSKTANGAVLVVWCQISQNGWDVLCGSEFIVEFQLAGEPTVGLGGRRERLGGFLSELEREEVRKIQNSVIASLSRPPQSHPYLHISQQVSSWYLGRFRPVTEPYGPGQDIWFRYASPAHVQYWAQFIRRKLPQCLEAIQSWG